MKKALLFVFLSLIIIKLLLIPLVPVPLGYSDSLAYMEQAKTFFETKSISKLIETTKFMPLYTLIISPAYVFEDMNTVFLVMKIINVLLSSLIIFPTYILAKEFFTKKKSLIIAGITALIPTIFVMKFYILSENLYFPLLITAIYCMYKTFSQYKWYWASLTGIILGLSLLTRFSAIVLIIVLFLLMLLKVYKKETKAIPATIITLFTLILTIMPWIYLRGEIFAWTLEGILQGYSTELPAVSNQSYILVKIIWTFLYTNYLFLGLGILAAILAITTISDYKNKTKKEQTFIEVIFFLSITTLFLAANISGDIIPYNLSRVIGRYVAPLFPFWILLSFMTERINKIYLGITSIFLLTTTPMILFAVFFPINNSELIWIEALKIIFKNNLTTLLLISLIIIIVTLILTRIQRIRFQNYFVILAIYLMTISLLSTCAIIYDAQQRWQPLEEVQLGYWITENISPEATFYFDYDDLECFQRDSHEDRTNAQDRPITVIAYWIRGEIINQKELLYPCTKETISTNYDYLITTKEMGLELIKEGETIKIYKNA